MFINTRGFSLTGSLLGIGIMSVIAMGLASVMSDANSSAAQLAQKLELLALKTDLTETLANPAVCTCQLQGVNISGAKGANNYINIPSIKAGCSASSPALAIAGQILPGSQTRMRVSTIQIGNLIEVTGSNDLRGTILVTPDPNSTRRSFRAISVTQSVKVDASGRIVACTFDSFSAKTCTGNQILVGVDEKNFPICRTLASCLPNQSLIGYDAAGNANCRNLPSCPAGRVLQSVSANGSPVCVDGSQIANIPTQSIPVPPVATIPTTPGATPIVDDAPPVVASAPPPANFVTATTLLGAGGKPTCNPGEAKKDEACSNACISAGAIGGSFTNNSCDKGQIQCICNKDNSRFPLAFTSPKTGLPKCPSGSVANLECSSACKKAGKSGGGQESCLKGTVQCLCT